MIAIFAQRFSRAGEKIVRRVRIPYVDSIGVDGRARARSSPPADERNERVTAKETMMRTRELTRCLGVVGFMIWASAPGCATSDATDPAVPSWEEYQKHAERIVDGHKIYIVEWDIALTLEQLRDYYDTKVAHPNIGVTDQASTVNVVSGH